ncbi:cilia- and flagella-associated protein 99 [Patella vulgata]|uniref:cilia- and flagella-associated protein 99 n=1 Tax=Patella vulgata TaxID=6465 RepID=UPI00218083F1|nr:cilia- and flagella-associated protein 99 [Patella vulgata]XP_050399588.1 cilia- and flagella-associated protein 99 [Patella vulgata]XP_050399589.1 cilia- and flagella-associated protein 99 [Patella vulgata]
MALSHGQILQHCSYILDTYDSGMVSVEEHIQQYFENNQILEEDIVTFVIEVFSGCVRYSSVIKVVIDGFYIKDGKIALRAEQGLYSVLCYLILFRLDELGVSQLRKFVYSQDINRIYKLLNFFLDEKNLLTWIRDKWCSLYENSFVQTVLLSPLMRWHPELLDLLNQMKDRIENKVKAKKKQTPTTEVKPFNITQPRARQVPLPEVIPKVAAHKPVPKHIYRTPSELDTLNLVKEANRRKAEEHLMEASRMQFACANTEKSEKTKEIMSNIMAEQDAKLDFDKNKINRAPPPIKEKAVKLNTATILREGLLYQRREAEVIKKLENLEAGAKDTTPFLKWQSEMRQRDLEVQLAEIERRRFAGKLSYEEAIIARQNLTKENQQRVLEMKEETQQIMQEYLERRFKEEQEMRHLVEQTMQGHKNTKTSMKKLQEYKQSIVQEVNEESRELMKLALEKAEEDMRRKMELISEIRAMEAVPVIRFKFVDLTSTAGVGLLSEMSIAELRERLCLMKTAEKEEEELKRDEILASKQAKDQLLLDTLETISKHRTEQTKSAAIRFEERKKNKDKKIEIKDEKLTELQRKLEEKKSARLREQGNNRIKASPQSAARTRTLISQKKALEENRWEKLERRRERTAFLSSHGMTPSKTAQKLTAF